jgi:hypothetical protein
LRTLRACFATLLLQQNKAPAVIIKICGWRDLKARKRCVMPTGVYEKGATDGLSVFPDASLTDNYCLSFSQKS